MANSALMTAGDFTDESCTCTPAAPVSQPVSDVTYADTRKAAH